MKQVTTHELARIMLAEPEMPVAEGRYLGVYQCGPTEFLVLPDGKLVFDTDPPAKKAKAAVQTVWWISGPLI